MNKLMLSDPHLKTLANLTADEQDNCKQLGR